MPVSTAVICQLTVASSRMELSTAAIGGMVVQVSELSIVQVAFEAVVIRPASAPGNLSVK